MEFENRSARSWDTRKVIYKHIPKKLTSVIKSAEHREISFNSDKRFSKLAHKARYHLNLSFTLLAELYGNKPKVKSLRMVASNGNPLLVLP